MSFAHTAHISGNAPLRAAPAGLAINICAKLVASHSLSDFELVDNTWWTTLMPSTKACSLVLKPNVDVHRWIYESGKTHVVYKRALSLGPFNGAPGEQRHSLAKQDLSTFCFFLPRHLLYVRPFFKDIDLWISYLHYHHYHPFRHAPHKLGFLKPIVLWRHDVCFLTVQTR